MTIGNIQRSREIGDKVGLRWTPSNYTPATVSGYSDATTQLTSHLAGIDTKFGSVASVVSATVTAAETVAQYDAVYIDTSVGQIRKCANNQNVLVANFFGLVTQSGGITASASGTVVINGAVTNGSWTPWIPFQQVYVGSTPGSLTQTPPTSNGQYVIPIGVAISTTAIQVNPETGWEVAGSTPAYGVGKLAFNQLTTTATVVIPSPNATITQVIVVVTAVASAGGATISVGTPTSPAVDLDTTYVDLMNIGTYIYEPYTDLSSSPAPEIVTVVAGGQTFSGTVYVFYSVPSQLTGSSGIARLAFSQATSSPYTMLTLPNSSTITDVICIVDTTNGVAGGTLSVGVVGTVDRDFKTTDNDLSTAGIYMYKPMTDCGSNAAPIIATIAAGGQTFTGRLYVKYIVPI